MPRPGLTPVSSTAVLLTRVLFAAVLLVTVPVGCSLGADPGDETSPKGLSVGASPRSALPFDDPVTPMGPLATPSWRVGVDALGDHAGAAFLGYLDAIGTVREDGTWELTLASERMADRAAFGALELDIAFSRHHEDLSTLTGSTVPTEEQLRIGLSPESTLAASRARLEAVAEVAGTSDGTLVRSDDPETAARVVRLAERLGLSPRTTVDGDENVVDLPDLTDRATVAGWSYVCPLRVPGAGAPSCWTPTPSSWIEPFDTVDADRWLVATTGPLADPARDRPPTEAGGVSWTNREAQVYSPDQVTVRDGALWLEAETNAVPSIDTTPFVSGMVISNERIGWGRVEVDVTVPQGAGLWPAVWLLPIAACEAPGRCPGYQSRRYVEVDLLETIGHEPGRLHTSVHWFDDRLQSATAVHQTGIDDGDAHTVWVEWRPGVITHGVDTEPLVSFPTALDATSPLSATPDHRLVFNLAVGGTFAGDGVMGRGANWWGDASPPPGWPTLDWDQATLAVHEARYDPLS